MFLTFAPSPLPTTGGCAQGWFKYGGRCYKLHGNRFDGKCNATINSLDCIANWQDAQDRCKLEGGNLVTIHDKYENGEKQA